MDVNFSVPEWFSNVLSYSSQPAFHLIDNDNDNENDNYNDNDNENRLLPVTTKVHIENIFWWTWNKITIHD